MTHLKFNFSHSAQWPSQRHPLALNTRSSNRQSNHASVTATVLGVATGLVLAGVALPEQAFAQSSSQSHALGESINTFSVPEGPLDAALIQFARAASVHISYDAALIKGLNSKGLSGQHSIDSGLSTLLAGTNIQALAKSGGGYALRKRPAGSAHHSLSKVVVTANQLGEITEGSGSYAPGSIATATRLVMSQRETPQSISVVTREEMNDFNLTSIDKVMEHTPGISIVTYDTERNEYYARGFAIQNFQYDGIPMLRDPSYSAGNTLSDSVIYDRVEVLKGATGLLTGSGDPGATINLVRKKPSYETQGHASLGIGSWNYKRLELDLGGALNESKSLRGRVAAAYQDKESHLDRYERQTVAFYGILEADITPSSVLSVGVDYLDSDPTASTWGGIPIYNTDGTFHDRPRSFNQAANWSSWQQYVHTAFATFEHEFDNNWVLKAQYNHQINGYDAALSGAAAGNPDALTGANMEAWRGKYVGKTVADALDIYASGPFSLLGRQHELVIGANVSKRRWTNIGYSPGRAAIENYYNWDGNIVEPDWASAESYTDDETVRENGVYLTTRLNLHDGFKLIAGTRIANYKSEPDWEGAHVEESGVLVPYLGGVYDLSKQLSAYASYSSIFKPQTKRDVNGDTIDPLIGKNLEIGLKGEFFDKKLNASIAYFHLNHDNYAQGTDQNTPSGGTAYRTIDGVGTKGFELDVSGNITAQWQIHAGLNHKVSKQQGDKVSTLTPENQFSFYTSYKPASVSGLTVGGGARWQDKTWGGVKVNDTSRVDHVMASFWVMDLMANYQLSKKLSLNLNINNVLDKKYHTIFNWYSTYTWGEPRSAMMTLKYTY